MDRYVLDASVILKWVVGEEREPDQDKAMALLVAFRDGKLDLAAPSLWLYEVGNFLGRMIPAEAVEKMRLLIDLGIRTIDLTTEAIPRCLDWMGRCKVTFYDAAYLALAVEWSATLVTADEAFMRRMKGVGHIRALKDLDVSDK
jgi:predicted nucleic acid-binding protein